MISLRPFLRLSAVRCRPFCGKAEVSGSKAEEKSVDTSDTEVLDKDLKYVTYEKFEQVALIGMNRPEKRNAVNFDMALELRQTFQHFLADTSTCVAVLYGHGGNFCAGYDLEELSQVEGNPLDYLEKEHGPMGPTRIMMSKPVIGAVSGYAVAGGLELALMCDVRIAENDAVFGVLCRRFGVPLVDGGTVRLPAVVGLGRAMDMILTGRPVKCDEAYEWGLVNRVTDVGTALGTATLYANELVKYPQICLRSDRRSAFHAAHSGTHIWEKLMFEFRAGKKSIAQESVEGAKMFASGKGKHGKFFPNLQEEEEK